MTASPTNEETALWQRRIAAQANNAAWRLSELSGRSLQQDEDMLQAAHAAMHLWKMVGQAGNRAHAALLLAHVYALLHLPGPAAHHLAQAEPHFFGKDCEPWELACAVAIRANVAAAAHRSALHESSYREAEALIAALPDAVDRDILNATLRVVPTPTSANAADLDARCP